MLPTQTGADISARADMPAWPLRHRHDGSMRRGGTGVAPRLRAMLRITTTIRPEGTALALEGRLAGPWVEELARSWTSLTAARDARSVRVLLDAVTFVDVAGKALLRSMHAQGATLVASGCMTRAIVEEIGGSGRG